MPSRNTCLSRQISLLTGAAGLALAVSASADPATVLLWNNAAGGSAGTPGNWNPVGLPAAADILNFNLAGNYAVSFPATVPTCAQMNFNVGTLSLSTLVPHTATSQFALGLNAGSTPNVTLAAGSLSSGIISVASNATSTSTLTITGPTADMFSTGSAGTRIGNPGNGTLTIANGGSLRSTNLVNIGSSAGSQGTVVVTGVNGASASELVTLNSVNGNLNIASGGPGTLTVGSGGLVDIAASVFIAPTAGIAGSATVGLGNFNVAGDLHVGHNTTAAASGTGTYAANSTSTTTVTGDTFVGDSAGGTGTLVVNQGADVFTRSLTIESTQGVLTHNGGVITLTGGVLTVPNNLLVINGAAGGLPRLTLNNSGCTLAAISPARAITLGTSRNGTLSLLSNATASVLSGDIVLGDSAGSSGEVQIQLGATLTQPNTGTFTVGNNGNGSILLGGAGHLSIGSLQVGSGVTGTGTINTGGPNSTIHIAGTLAVGGTFSSAGGTGSVTIGNGTTVTVDGGAVNFPVQVWNGGGSLTINSGGTLTSTGAIRVSGDFTLAGGTVNVNNVVLQGATSYPMTGTLSSTMQPQVGAIVNLTGPLSVRSILNDGTINVGDHTLTLSPTVNSEFIGNTSVGALGRIAAFSPLTINSGKVLSGDGTIDAAINNSGTITATGDGLTLNGLVTGIGQGINGTTIEFGPTGGFTGSGTFSSTTAITVQAGAKLTITGPTSLGDGTTKGFVCDGELDITGSLDISDSNGIGLGSLTTLRNASLSCTSPINMNNSPTLDVLRGTGSVHARVNNRAVISPGIAEGDRTGVITVFGNYAEGSGVFNGTLDLEVAGTDGTLFDHIIIVGNAALAGTVNLTLIDGYFPVNGDSIPILTASTLTGTFGTENLPHRFHLEYSSFGVRAVFCSGDFNDDGALDFFDYDDFVAAFEAGTPDADFDGDGTIDFFDYDAFVTAFEQGC